MRRASFTGLITILLSLAGTVPAGAFPVGEAAWSNAEWEARCKPVRTTYNPTRPLSTTALTLSPTDERFVDFLYWVWANKIAEHQVEQVGGTEWEGPEDGVIFHWAPGSRWEMHTVVSFEHALHHLAEEHKWTDRMFPGFFEPFGGVRGVSIKERLSMTKAPTWAMLLEHIGGPDSPYYRYVFHQESGVDPERRTVVMVGGQGVVFEYGFERYLSEIKEVLTDCKAFQFFVLYDLHGKGFASTPGWAGQPVPESAHSALTGSPGGAAR